MTRETQVMEAHPTESSRTHSDRVWEDWTLYIYYHVSCTCYVFGIWRHVTLFYDLDKKHCIVVAVIFSGIVRMSSLLLSIPVCKRKHLMLQVYVWQYEYVCDEISVYIDLFCPLMARSVVLNKGASSINEIKIKIFLIFFFFEESGIHWKYESVIYRPGRHVN